MSDKKIFKSMVAIMRGIDAISKDKRNQQQGFNFRGIDDVMNELHGVMAKEGVFVLPEAAGETSIQEKTTAKGGTLRFVVQKWRFHFVADDGSEVSGEAIGEAMDSGDKAMNKSMSIALKYVLLQTFMIPTIEDKDPDINSHSVLPNFADVRGISEYIAGSGLDAISVINAEKKKWNFSDETVSKIVDMVEHLKAGKQ